MNVRAIVGLLHARLLIAPLVFLVVMVGLAAPADARDERAGLNAPLVAVLTPYDGRAVNATSLRVQALVAAFKPHALQSFVFNGATVAGKNVGRVSHVELAVDGVLRERLEAEPCGRQMLADFRVDLTGLAAGAHTLTVTAYQGDRRAGIGGSVSTTFTLDPTLPQTQMNRVEEAATPRPFTCLALRVEDDDRAHRRPARLDLVGAIVLGPGSDGIDPARDRVVIAVGSSVTVLEPGALRCKREGQDGRTCRFEVRCKREGQDGRTCRFEDRSQPLVQKVELKQKKDGRWEIELQGDPLPTESQRLYLRIGNDWGGIDLGTGELLAGLRPLLDTARRAQATIGAGGGTIEARDALGVLIQLQIPAGALTQDTEITVTPLLASPIPVAGAALHPGVKFEPEGLVFAEPVTLTLDFSATGQAITDGHFVFLLTSPLTALPLYGTVDPATRTLTAVLHHFSTIQGGAGSGATIDLAAWADPILSSTGNATLVELQSLVALAALQQQLGCSLNCIDLGQIIQKATDSINALVTTACGADVAAPTDDGLRRWIALEAFGQQLGADSSAVRGCMERVLRALIGKAATDGLLSPSDAAVQRLVDLTTMARQLGFPTLETLARDKTEAVLKAVIDRDGDRAATDPSDANLQRLIQLKAKAHELGFAGLETLVLRYAARGARTLIAQAQPRCDSDDEADKTAGKALLLRAQSWAAVANLDPSVDSTLSSDLERATANCGGSAMVMRTNLFLGWSGVWSEAVGMVPIPTGSTPPFSVSDGGSTTISVTKPEPNVIAFDASAAGTSFGLVFFELVLSKPGTLVFELDPAWAANGVALVVASRNLAPFVLGINRGVASDRTSGTIAITSPQTQPMFFAFESFGATANGRALTVTFTPAPAP